MVADDTPAKSTPAPKAESTPTPKAESTPAPKADSSGASSSKPSDTAPTSYSRGEGQKSVTQTYRDNWNAIFANPTRKKATPRKTAAKKVGAAKTATKRATKRATKKAVATRRKSKR